MTGTSTAINNTTIEADDINKHIGRNTNYDSCIDKNDIASRNIFFHQLNSTRKALDKSQSLPWITNHTIHQLIRFKDSGDLTPLKLSYQCTNSILCQSRSLGLLKFVQ